MSYRRRKSRSTYDSDSRSSRASGSKRSESPELNLDSKTFKRYKEELEHERYSLAKDYDHYFLSPEEHPMYRNEWAKFWDVRSEQLRRDGIKPENYDFGDEWREFFLSRLKILKAKDFYDLKAKIDDKYRIHSKKNRSKNEHRSSSEFSISEDERYNSNSRGHSSKRRKVSTEKKVEPPSVVSVCRDLSCLDPLVIFNRRRFNDLMYKAMMHEKNHNREYLMNKEECELFKVLLPILRHIILVKKLSKTSFDQVKDVCSKIEYLVGVWEKFTNDTNNFFSSISSSSSLESLNNISQFMNQKTDKKDHGNEQKRSSETSTVSKSIEPTLNRLKYYSRQMDEQRNGSSSATGKPEQMSPVPIKIEKVDTQMSPDMLSLMLEKQRLLKEIYESGEFPKLLINNGAMHQETGSESDIHADFIDALNQNTTSAAKCITDDELISYLKDLENLTTEKQNCIYKIMVDIEHNDQERFNRLKNYIYHEEQGA